MTRPAIIIGLGGTGQQVVTYLKKELLEIGGGQMPPGIKLLAFDTASPIPPQGDVTLEKGTEYICIGADLYDLAEEIREGKHAHLQWFPTKTYNEKNLPRAAYITTQGAGGIRQFGRLSLFHEVHFVLAHLERAITDLQSAVAKPGDKQDDYRLLEILIVGSLAGGTGAGMLVDMAWLARKKAETMLREKFVVRGFFVLPSAFTIEERNMMARSYAAWVELNRAMISKKGSGNVIIYNPYDQGLWVKCDKPAYDVTYLIDPQRADKPILPPPDEGIFPAIAHIMSFILDEQAGVTYTEHLINTIATVRANLPRGVYHSAIGAYTLKVPVYYAQSRFSHQLALDVLKDFLAPEFNEKGRVIRVSQLANKQVSQGVAGLQAAVGFLSASALNIGGKNIPNTKLAQLVGDTRARNAQENGEFITHSAQGGLTTTLLPFFNALNKITEYDPERNQIIDHELTEELKWHVWKEVPPSRNVGDAPEQAFARITNPAMPNSVPSVRKRRYGMETVTGPDQRLRGTFGDDLEKSKAAQLQRFKDLLHAQTLYDLNGDNSDARIARGGKIGYVLAFYNELASACDYFIGFLNKVRVKRNQELKVARMTRDAADRAMKTYQAEMGKRCWLTFWDDFVHPDAHRAQRNYLMAEQRDIDVRRGDILLDVLAETVAEIKVYVEKTRDEVNNWIAHLATGDPNLNLTGLYPLVQESLNNLNVNHELDKRLGNPNFQQEKQLRKVSQIIGEHEYKSDDRMIIEPLEKIHWKVEQAADGLRLSCGIEFPGEKPEDRPQYKPFSRSGERPAQHNLGLLLRLSERPFRGLRQDQPIAREVREVYPEGQQLADALKGHAEPFYRPSAVAQKPAVKTAYMRVDYQLDGQTTDYFMMQFVPQFHTLHPDLGSLGPTLVLSQDRYKLTLLRSDDLMPSESFAQWDACQQKYVQHINDPTFGTPAEELYTFPAEVNAAYFEAIMPGMLKQNYHKLQAEAVSLLEDRNHFAMFFLAAAHSFIHTETSEGGGKFWSCRLPRYEEAIYLTLPPAGLQQVQIDLFQVIRAFLSGHDQRPGSEEVKKIDWGETLKPIFNRERELGRAKSVEAYRCQIDGDDGLVKMILAQEEAVRKSPGKEFAQPRDYRDLAELARVVYLEAIQRVDNAVLDKA